MSVTWLVAANNATTTLAENLAAGETTMTVASETALAVSTFPFHATLWDHLTYGSDNPANDPNMEVVKVTGRADVYDGDYDYDYGQLLTIVRAQESTSDVAHDSGQSASRFLTATMIQQIQDELDALDVRVTALEP